MKGSSRGSSQAVMEVQEGPWPIQQGTPGMWGLRMSPLGQRMPTGPRETVTQAQDFHATVAPLEGAGGLILPWRRIWAEHLHAHCSRSLFRSTFTETWPKTQLLCEAELITDQVQTEGALRSWSILQAQTKPLT
ncbi:hypothetical protein Cadr_000017250 [Camelus dromedarius]|uniref:Uncharacterized protein n=1 Tax=Camelus dromedarius TaxID=9838 RepID=A0A5N4DGC1_CAMDR|nr:hypothetical protein Cadr_000017250 [Camelus dromedarius]